MLQSFTLLVVSLPQALRKTSVLLATRLHRPASHQTAIHIAPSQHPAPSRGVLPCPLAKDVVQQAHLPPSPIAPAVAAPVRQVAVDSIRVHHARVDRAVHVKDARHAVAIGRGPPSQQKCANIGPCREHETLRVREVVDELQQGRHTALRSHSQGSDDQWPVTVGSFEWIRFLMSGGRSQLTTAPSCI